MKHIVSIIVLITLAVVFAPSLPATGQETAGGDDLRARIEERVREYTQRLDRLTDGAAGKAAERARELMAKAEQRLKELKPHAEAALKEIESSLRELMERVEREMGGSRKDNKGEWI